MKDFNQNIKNKIDGYQFEETLTDEKVIGFFEKLDSIEVPKEADKEEKVVPLYQAKNKQFSFLKIAASVAILVASSILVYVTNNVTIKVDNGLSQSVTLPDGSIVQINATSELSYNKLTWNWSRALNLEGEAFFEVQKGEKFTVISKLGSTQVLGTSFNIFARNNSYKVQCYTGKVVVTSNKTDKQVQLLPGNGVSIINHDLTAFDFNNKANKDWRQGEFYFENTPIKEVFNTLARQYNVKVYLDASLENQEYTGYFNNKDLQKSLKLICEPIGLSYQINENIITIN